MVVLLGGGSAFYSASRIAQMEPNTNFEFVQLHAFRIRTFKFDRDALLFLGA